MLLPGEQSDSPYPEDAEHWVRVYEELVSLCERMLEGPPSGRAAGEAAQADRGLLEERMAHYRQRLAF